MQRCPERKIHPKWPGDTMEKGRRKERLPLVGGAGGCEHLGCHGKQHTPKNSCIQEGMMPSLRDTGGQGLCFLS